MSHPPRTEPSKKPGRGNGPFGGGGSSGAARQQQFSGSGGGAPAKGPQGQPSHRGGKRSNGSAPGYRGAGGQPSEQPQQAAKTVTAGAPANAAADVKPSTQQQAAARQPSPPTSQAAAAPAGSHAQPSGQPGSRPPSAAPGSGTPVSYASAMAAGAKQDTAAAPAAVHFQFGTINEQIFGGGGNSVLQLPPRTSSAPPNLIEQERAAQEQGLLVGIPGHYPVIPEKAHFESVNGAKFAQPQAYTAASGGFFPRDGASPAPPHTPPAGPMPAGGTLQAMAAGASVRHPPSQLGRPQQGQSLQQPPPPQQAAQQAPQPQPVPQQQLPPQQPPQQPMHAVPQMVPMQGPMMVQQGQAPYSPGHHPVYPVMRKESKKIKIVNPVTNEEVTLDEKPKSAGDGPGTTGMPSPSSQRPGMQPQRPMGAPSYPMQVPGGVQYYPGAGPYFYNQAPPAGKPGGPGAGGPPRPYSPGFVPQGQMHPGMQFIPQGPPGLVPSAAQARPTGNGPAPPPSSRSPGMAAPPGLSSPKPAAAPASAPAAVTTPASSVEDIKFGSLDAAALGTTSAPPGLAPPAATTKAPTSSTPPAPAWSTIAASKPTPLGSAQKDTGLKAAADAKVASPPAPSPASAPAPAQPNPTLLSATSSTASRPSSATSAPAAGAPSSQPPAAVERPVSPAVAKPSTPTPEAAKPAAGKPATPAPATAPAPASVPAAQAPALVPAPLEHKDLAGARKDRKGSPKSAAGPLKDMKATASAPAVETRGRTEQKPGTPEAALASVEAKDVVKQPTPVGETTSGAAASKDIKAAAVEAPPSSAVDAKQMSDERSLNPSEAATVAEAPGKQDTSVSIPETRAVSQAQEGRATESKLQSPRSPTPKSPTKPADVEAAGKGQPAAVEIKDGMAPAPAAAQGAARTEEVEQLKPLSPLAVFEAAQPAPTEKEPKEALLAEVPLADMGGLKAGMAVNKKAQKRAMLKAADLGSSSGDYLYDAYSSDTKPDKKAAAAAQVAAAQQVAAAKSKEKQKSVVPPSPKELEDWEDAAELPTPKVRGESTNGRITYSRDFLFRFRDMCAYQPEDMQFFQELMLGGIYSDNVPVNAATATRGAMGLGDDWRKTPGLSLSALTSMGQPGTLGPGRLAPGGGAGPVLGPGGGMGRFGMAQAGGMMGGLRPVGMAAGMRGAPDRPGMGPGQFGPGGLVPPVRGIDADQWTRKGPLPQPRGVPPVGTHGMGMRGPAPALHKAEQRFTVGQVTDEEQKKQKLVKGILNKLTPQNFDKMVDQFDEIGISSADTLNAAIGQIFEKAVFEPTFCEMYAALCVKLAEKLPEFTRSDENTEEKITFKRVLLTKCQEEFERGEAETAAAMKAEEDEKTKQEGDVKLSAEEIAEMKTKARRRSLGNIRFIGELYKKSMLTERIMHECIRKLLGEVENPDEEDVEALCKLVSTVGQRLDHAKAQQIFDSYFRRIEALSHNMKLSSRIRFMLQDLIDLRNNRWVTRRKVEGPKKIEEVHRDAAEAMRGGGGGGGRRGPMPGPPPMSGGPGRRGPEPPMSFGMPPPRSSSTGNLYGPGAGPPGLSGPGAMPVPRSMARTGPPGANFGDVRLSEPSPGIPLRDPVKSGTGVVLGPNAGALRPMSAGRTAPAAAAAQDRSRLSSGDASLRPGATPPAAPAKSPPATTPAVSPPATPQPLSEEEFTERTKSFLNELYNGRDVKEAQVANMLWELHTPDQHADMVTRWVTGAAEVRDAQRDMLASVLVHLATKPASLSKEQAPVLASAHLLKGLEGVLGDLEMLAEDFPNAPLYIGKLYGLLIAHGALKIQDVAKPLFVAGEPVDGPKPEGPGELVQSGLAGKVVAELSSTLRREKGEDFMVETLKSSSIPFKSFLPEDMSEQKFTELIQKHQLQALFPLLHVEKRLQDGLNDDPAALAQWIEESVPAKVREGSELTTLVVRCVLDSAIPANSAAPSKPQTIAGIQEAKELLLIVVRSGSSQQQKEKQISCLRAVLTFCNARDFQPKGLIAAIFSSLDNLEIVDYDQFLNWKDDIKDLGKPKQRAVTELNQWFSDLEVKQRELEREE